MALFWSFRTVLVVTALELLSLVVTLPSASAGDITVTANWLAASKDAPFPTAGPPIVCPAQCDCFNYHETVDCSRRDLDQIPLSLPSVVRRLYVEGNHIEDLGDGRLSVAANLSVLIVEDNRLTELNVDALCLTFLRCP